MMNILNFRKLSAYHSGFKSSKSIRNMVKLILDNHSRHCYGDILDFGAGKCDLLFELINEKKFKNYFAADIIDMLDIVDMNYDVINNLTWITKDLNTEWDTKYRNKFNVIIASEIIEHLENPRFVFRQLFKLLKEGGILIITTPNNHSIRSMLNYLFRSHFTDFLDDSYPAHIMPMIKKDLDRITDEVGFSNTKFYFSNHGKIPKLIKYSFQQASFGYLKGKYFSDNLGLVTEKPFINR